jgi:glycoprotease/Kae1 family metallohydrolase
MQGSKLLAIECTAHTLGASVVEKNASGKVNAKNTQILSNEYDRYPALKEGFIPRKLADHHAKVFGKVVKQALANAKVEMKEIDAFAYSYGPGIGHCLHVGYVGAHSLCMLNGKPLVPVNHTVAHAEIGRFEFGFDDPLVVYVSGGNTQIAALAPEKDARYYRVLGETMDVGIGNFLDVLGRSIDGVKPPNAIGLIQCAQKADKSQLLDLPYTVKGMDLAFSGLLTASLREIKAGRSKEEVCFSAQETALSMLVEACERALCHANKKQVLLVGGVAQNPRCQQMIGLMAKEHGCKVGIVPPALAGDNAGMIGVTAMQMLESRAPLPKPEPNSNLRLDQTEITW